MHKEALATNKELSQLLDQLIQLLVEESGNHDSYQEASFAEKLAIWRGLINQKAPSEVTSTYLSVESQFLTQYFAAEEIATIADCQPTNHAKILLYHGDITHLAVDAIVNAANSEMLGCFIPNHDCIDNAIHTFAGVKLRLACQKIMQKQNHKEAIGHAKLTLGYHLPANYIIHTVGPQVSAQQKVSRLKKDLLKKCYQACLATATKHKLASIAFCSISTGVFGFPKEIAAEIAVATVLDWINQHPDAPQIIFVTYTKKDQALYQGLLRGKRND